MIMQIVVLRLWRLDFHKDVSWFAQTPVYLFTFNTIWEMKVLYLVGFLDDVAIEYIYFEYFFPTVWKVEKWTNTH